MANAPSGSKWLQAAVLGLGHIRACETLLVHLVNCSQSMLSIPGQSLINDSWFEHSWSTEFDPSDGLVHMNAFQKDIANSLEYELEPILDQGILVLHLSGSISMSGPLGPSIRRRLLEAAADSWFRKLVVDLSKADSIDTSGAVLLALLRKSAHCRKARFEFSGAEGSVRDFLSWVDLDSLVLETQTSTRVQSHGPLVSVGEAALAFLENLRFFFSFVGALFLAGLRALLHPRSFRGRHMLACLEQGGVNALPIITLIHFLVGLVLAFQASIQLRQFGANIFVADLVGLAQVREFGPLVTAVLLAGRSGSAFAAELGTMQVNEEIDALKALGIDPVRFLVLPKTVALILAMPLLTLYADFMGILGGLTVGVLGLDLTIQGYLLETQKALDLFDVFSGIIKSFAFAWIVAGVGCLRGLQTKGGAESVGKSATSAVVAGIFLIIVADAVFTVIFQYV